MPKQRDWLDYTNTAANAFQAAQLSAVREHLLVLSCGLAKQEATSALQAKWRHLLSQYEQLLTAARENLGEGQIKSAYAAARLVKHDFERLGVSASLFTDWADIDRANSILIGLDSLLNESASQALPEWEQEIADCIRWESEASELDELIRFSTMWGSKGTLPTLEERANVKKQSVALKCPPAARRLHQFAWSTAWIAFGSFVGLFFSFTVSAPSLTTGAVNRLTVVFVGSFVAAAVLEASATIAVKMSEVGKSQTRIRQLDQLLAKGGLLAHDLQRIEALVEKFGGYGAPAKFVALRERRHRQCHALLAPSSPQ